jgi:site-specific recombinase XerD
MLLKEAIEDYLLYLEHERSASRETLRTYRPALRRFREWVQANGHPVPTLTDITTPLARRYLYHLSELGLRPRSRLRYWLPLRSLFRMLVEHGAVTESPLETIALPKKDPAPRLLVTDGELLQVLQAAGRQRSPWRAARDQAVLAVLIYTGLRRGELINLRLEDLRLGEGLLHVAHGKGNRARVVPLCAEAKAYLERWLEVRPTVEHPYLFTTDEVRRLAENGLRSLLEQAKTVAGLAGAENIKPHSIRHAAATRLLQNGADLRSVMAWLGHSHLQTTAIYLHTDEQRLQAIASLASLRSTPEPGGPSSRLESVGMPNEPSDGRPGRRLRRTSRQGH